MSGLDDDAGFSEKELLLLVLATIALLMFASAFILVIGG